MSRACDWWLVETANCRIAPVHMWVGTGPHLTLKLLYYSILSVMVQKSSSTQAFRQHNDEILFYSNLWNKRIFKSNLVKYETGAIMTDAFCFSREALVWRWGRLFVSLEETMEQRGSVVPDK